LDGHVGNVYVCRYFPSGVVVLSGGADCRAKIWSVETGECAATLTGHSAGTFRYSSLDISLAKISYEYLVSEIVIFVFLLRFQITLFSVSLPT